MKEPLKEKVRPRRRPSSNGTGGKSTDLNPPAHEAKKRKLSQGMPRGWEAGFQSAFDQAAIGMALLGLDGRWLRVNPALCKIVGYSEQELLATDFQTVTHPEDLDADLSYVRQMLSQKIRSYQME